MKKTFPNKYLNILKWVVVLAVFSLNNNSFSQNPHDNPGIYVDDYSITQPKIDFLFTDSTKKSFDFLSKAIEEIISSKKNKSYKRNRSFLIQGKKGNGRKLFLKSLASKHKAVMITIDCTSFVSLSMTWAEAIKTVNTIIENCKNFILNTEVKIFLAFESLETVCSSSSPMIQFLANQVDSLNNLSEQEMSENKGEMFFFGITKNIADIDGSLRKTGRFCESAEVGAPEGKALQEFLIKQREAHNKKFGLEMEKGTLDQVFKKATKLTFSNIIDWFGLAYSEAKKDGVRAVSLEFFNKTLKTVCSMHNLSGEAESGIRKIQLGFCDPHSGEKTSFTINLYLPGAMKKSFKDIILEDSVKKQVEDVIEYMRNPSPFQIVGAKLVSGILLFGPPGTGKTLLAKVIAGESNVCFISVNAPLIVSKYIGESANNMRNLFESAKKAAEEHNTYCIIYIDEIDAIAKSRGSSSGACADTNQQVLNQLLMELDGFDERNNRILVIASTNQEALLDSALTRYGRLERKVFIGNPSLNLCKKQIELLKHTYPIDPSVNLDLFAVRLLGMSCADIEGVFNDAAILTGKENKRLIPQQNLESAYLNKVMGLENSSYYIPEKERRETAFHEAGHALFGCESIALGKFDKFSPPLTSVTCLSRGAALGVTYSNWTTEKHCYSRDELWSRIKMLLGGLVAEELLVGKNHSSNGVSSDLRHATDTAFRMVCNYGMSSHGLAYVDLEDAKKDPKIRETVQELLNQAYNECVEFLTVKRCYLEWLAEELCLRGTMSGEEVLLWFNHKERLAGISA